MHSLLGTSSDDMMYCSILQNQKGVEQKRRGGKREYLGEEEKLGGEGLEAHLINTCENTSVFVENTVLRASSVELEEEERRALSFSSNIFCSPSLFM